MKRAGDLAVVMVIPLVAAYVSMHYRVNAFWSVILFFGVLSVYLSWRSPQYIPKALCFSVITALPAIVMIDYVAHATGQWLIPHSILASRLFGYVTIEVVLWAILNFYAVTIFYKHFCDHYRRQHYWYPRHRHILIFGIGLLLLFFTLLFSNPAALRIPYFYLMFGTIFILLPVILEFVGHRQLIPKFLVTGAYFFYVSLLYELLALRLGWWEFPSHQFIGQVTLLTVTFPFEEFVFWLGLFAMGVLAFFVKFENSEG